MEKQINLKVGPDIGSIIPPIISLPSEMTPKYQKEAKQTEIFPPLFSFQPSRRAI